MKLGIITYYWPPAGGPGVQRWLKLSKYLAREGVQLYVVTVDAEKATYPLRDEGLLKDVDANIKVYRTETSEKFGAYKKVTGKKSVPFSGFSGEDANVSFLQKLADRAIPYTYVGNPLAQKYAGMNGYASEGSIALLPGSRAQEIARLLPEFIAVAQSMPEQTFVLIRSQSSVPVWPDRSLPANVEVFTGELKDGIKHCAAALVCSGTATLEVALLGVPQLVVYRANPISLAIAKRFVKISYFSLPNLILDAAALPELLQENARAEALVQRLGALLLDPSAQLNAYAQLRQLLEQKDPAASAAQPILTIASQS